MAEGGSNFFDTIRQSNPRLNAEKLGVLFSNFLGRAFRMSDMPLPAVIRLTAPGSMVCTVPRLSRYRISQTVSSAKNQKRIV